MVVASSNNGAVENITRELPNAAKLAERFRDGADNLKPLATQLLNRPIASDDGDVEDEQQPIEAWGLISAVLGNKKNRNAFVNTFREIDEPDPKRPGRRKRVDAHYNVFGLLAELSGRTDWNRARTEFEEALAEVKRLKNEIASVEELKAQVERLRRASTTAAEDVVRLEGRLSQVPLERSMLDAGVRLAENAAANAATEATDLWVARPGCFARLFNTSPFRQWQAAWLAAAAARKSRQTISGLGSKDS
jgi:hypothetical protein